MHTKLLTYALNKQNVLSFVDKVPNGLSCDCKCPYCGEKLIAKNEGLKKEHHFAHASGSECEKGYETALHLLAKEIIKEEKTIMVPQYKNSQKLISQHIHFSKVEIEERKDAPDIQPDCVGITNDGVRLHIEIYVTHPVDEVKKNKIIREAINCIEINIPKDFTLDKKRLSDFIVNNAGNRTWINYPFGDDFLVKEVEESQRKIISEFREKHPECIALFREKCDGCNILKRKAYEAFQDVVASYQNRLQPWAIPFSKMSPGEIADIDIDYTLYRRAPYITYKDSRYYFFPKNEEYTGAEHQRACKSTYGFFKKMNKICAVYNNPHLYHEQCPYYKEEFEYQGQSFVFCNKNKLSKVPIQYWDDIIIIPEDIYLLPDARRNYIEVERLNS